MNQIKMKIFFHKPTISSKIYYSIYKIITKKVLYRYKTNKLWQNKIKIVVSQNLGWIPIQSKLAILIVQQLLQKINKFKILPRGWLLMMKNQIEERLIYLMIRQLIDNILRSLITITIHHTKSSKRNSPIKLKKTFFKVMYLNSMS